MRLDKPIGIWLLFFPAAWAVLLAPAGNPWGLLAVMLLGAVLIRGAGCIVNDLTDRRLDRQVARTRTRPLASGALTRGDALLLLTVLLADGLILCLALPRPALALAVLALPFIAAYPWMKRWSWWPQAFLGLTFNFGALIGWAAAGAAFAPAPLLLYAACFCWTLGYDTLYAVQDMRDDATAGIRSSARRIGLGANLQRFIAACYGAMLLLFGLAAHAAGMLGAAAWLAIALAALHFMWQVRQAGRLKAGDPRAGMLFCSNQWLGLILLAGLLWPHGFAYLS